MALVVSLALFGAAGAAGAAAVPVAAASLPAGGAPLTPDASVISVARDALLARVALVAGVAPAGPASLVAAAPAWMRWGWPLQPVPRVLRRFDPPAQRWLAGHRGVDLAAAPGQPVLAAGAGTVAFAGYIVNRGVVVVAHGELRTTYEPVDASVARGDAVARGAVLGTVGTGSAHCPVTCLHWGLRRGGDYLDPLRLLRPGPVRLLPVWGRGPSSRG